MVRIIFFDFVMRLIDSNIAYRFFVRGYYVFYNEARVVLGFVRMVVGRGRNGRNGRPQ